MRKAKPFCPYCYDGEMEFDPMNGILICNVDPNHVIKLNEILRNAYY